MNRRASELTGHLDKADTGPATMMLSRLVSEHRTQMQDILDSRKAANIWEPFQLKRVIYQAGRKILVRGFGLADQNSYDDSRIILVLEEIRLGQEHKVQQVPALSESRKEISDVLVNEQEKTNTHRKRGQMKKRGQAGKI
jgi:hypothetical protein